jgi:acyl phosphate:glycerol-3-phosphate acyltransferase
VSLTDVLAIVAGYLLGSMPWGYWLPRLLTGMDVRAHGSGGTGAANVWRTVGFKIGLAVALLDVAKGTAAAVLGVWSGGEEVGLAAGIAAMAGHWRPLFLGFARGGKIVATTGGVALALLLLPTLAAAAVWIATFLATRYTSVASMPAAVSLPVFALLLDEPPSAVLFAVGAAVAILVLHRANIGRLVHGTENRFALRNRGATPQRSGPVG